MLTGAQYPLARLGDTILGTLEISKLHLFGFLFFFQHFGLRAADEELLSEMGLSSSSKSKLVFLNLHARKEMLTCLE